VVQHVLVLKVLEVDCNMFIVMRGTACACIEGAEGEIEVMQYGPADYFGEIAMLKGVPRKASVYATSQECVCLMIDEPSFRRVLGPVKDILNRKVSLYQSYASCMDSDSPIAAATTKSNHQGPRTRRKRAQQKGLGLGDLEGAEDGCSIALARKAKKEDSQDEPGTLQEKVAADFKRPALVGLQDKFKVKNSILSIVGGLDQGQKFMDDKKMHISMKKDSVIKEILPDSTTTRFAYTASPYHLKLPTMCNILCQKGQKSSADPCPNQDNVFYHNFSDGVLIAGVCDGHGPFGHIVSMRTCQTLPFYIQNSTHYLTDWKLCLEEAFSKADIDLREFQGQESLNFDVSGTTATVLIRHEQKLHIGWVGDSNMMVSSWTKQSEKSAVGKDQVIFSTKSHVPEVEEEKKRIESIGIAEIRETAPNSETYRIYMKGKNIPGLTMSRALGDFMLSTNAGVLNKPDYHCLGMQPGEEWYVLISSDGIWEFFPPEDVAKIIPKKLRLKGVKETCRLVCESSRRRWAQIEEDYCDDIGCIMLMFNSKGPDSGNNHYVTANCCTT